MQAQQMKQLNFGSNKLALKAKIRTRKIGKMKPSKKLAILSLLIISILLSSCVWAMTPGYQTNEEHRAYLQSQGDTSLLAANDIGTSVAPICWGIGILCIIWSSAKLIIGLPSPLIVDIIAVLTFIGFIIA